jgi:hypothetical protein
MKAGIVMHKIIVAGETKYLLFSSELLLQKILYHRKKLESTVLLLPLNNRVIP